MKVQGNRYINNPEMIKNKVEKQKTVPQNMISEDDVTISDSAKKLVKTTEKDIKRVIEQNKDEELYHFKISDDYKILYLDVSKEILNSQSTFTAKMSSLMTLTYDSEIYHVLNGTKNWSLQIIVTDILISRNGSGIEVI